MARYIDAEPIVKNLKSKIINPQTSFVNTVLIGLLDKAPAAEVAEVVRCEKCLFYEKVEYYHPTDKNPTKNVCRLLKRQMQPDDYCSYGERKVENG